MKEPCSTFNGLVQEWEKATKNLENYKKKEMELRKEVIAATFTANKIDIKEGANSVSLADGTVVHVTQPITRKVDEASYRHTLIDEETFNNLFTHKPALSMAAYRKLNEEERYIVDSCLIITSGTPQLSIKYGS